MKTGLLFEATDTPLVILPKQSGDLAKLFVCIGPGSYVGIRHSIAFAQAVQLAAQKQGRKIDVIAFSLFDAILSLGTFVRNTSKTQITVVTKAWPREKLSSKTSVEKVRVFYQIFSFDKGTYTPLGEVQSDYLPKMPLEANSQYVTTLPGMWKRAYPKIKAHGVSFRTLDLAKHYELIQPSTKHPLRPLYLSNAQYETTPGA